MQSEWAVENDETCPDPLRPRARKDSRGFFMLPQSTSGEGYYTYGELDRRLDKGAYQYPYRAMMSGIFCVAFERQAIDRRRFGGGNIRLPGGRPHTDHASHKNGLQVDVRPMRKTVARCP